ncbi:MAG TPA: hypothetical protein VNL17_00035 [Verrucomicrobiae bacterium]|nr:hypothetical protein [Verrucomicrobiae bacterium]
MKTYLNPKVLTMLGLLPWLVYFVDVRSQGYPQFVVLPLYALYPGPLHEVWTRTPEVYAIGIAVGAILLLLGLGGLVLKPKRLAFVAAVIFDVSILVLVIAVCIRHGFEKV